VCQQYPLLVHILPLPPVGFNLNCVNTMYTFGNLIHNAHHILVDYLQFLSTDSKKQRSPIVNYEHWARSWSRSLGSQPAGYISHWHKMTLTL